MLEVSSSSVCLGVFFQEKLEPANIPLLLFLHRTLRCALQVSLADLRALCMFLQLPGSSGMQSSAK